MITTGGTIASQEGEDGLEPKTTGQQMLDLIPELQGLCEIDCVDLLNLDSTNMQPEECSSCRMGYVSCPVLYIFP